MIQLQLKLKSFDPYYIQIVTRFIESLLTFLDMNSTKQISLPTRTKKITVIRSPHIDKNSREQFQIKKHKKFFQVELVDAPTTRIFLDILKNAEFTGVELEIHFKNREYFYKH
jgi:small subunit ribosomal protein S10